MSVKLAILKSGETIIAEIKELISDEKICGYLFEKPHVVQERTSIFLTEDTDETSRDLEISMSPWIILTKDDNIPIRPDWIVTIVEPIDTIGEMYEEKVNGKNSEMPSSEG
tara:strand:- start:230 stop:562 length:333 start_codon:yes stop_codon:yes gene_type:complete